MDIAKKTIRVLLADDQQIVRIGLRAMLKQFSNIEVVGDVGTAEDAVLEADRLKPDVMLLDVRMPGGPAFDACRKIKAMEHGIRVIFLTSFADDDGIFESISAGADGFLLKDVLPEELVNAITQVAEGRSVLDPDVTRRIMGRLKSGKERTKPSGLEVLSAQENRVIALVAQGKTNKEIGAEMGLSPKTVKNYLSNVLDKLALSRRSQAAAYYAQSVQKTNIKALYN